MKYKTIAVLGAGTMGPGIAVNYILAGCQTALYTRSQKTLLRAQEVVKANIDLFIQEGLISPEEGQAALDRIRYTDVLADAVAGADYVAETIVEQPEAKQTLYQQLDTLLQPETVIASNTSYLDIFPLVPETRRPYTIIAHFYAPAHILPLVEIVRGPDTLESVMDEAVTFHRHCGKTPVRMEKYIPGFIVNRMQSAMTREVIYLLENGYCTAEDLDLAVKTSLMPRGLLLGLVQRMDFTGLDMLANSLKNKKYIPAPDLTEPRTVFNPVNRGEYGVKTGIGLYDYSHAPYESVLDQRDRLLLESVRLAEKFIATPLHNKTGTG